MSELPDPVDPIKERDLPKENADPGAGENHDPKAEGENLPDTIYEAGASGSETGSTSNHLTANEANEPEEDDHDLGAVLAPIPSEERPATNPLDGLDEIVDAPGLSDTDEPAPKEESVDELAHIIEAVLFASDEPLNIGTIKSVLEASHAFGRVNPDAIVLRINALNAKYDSDETGFRIIEIAEGYQFATRKEMAQWVSYLFKEKAKRKLSNSALETLAIIAYKQPITKPEIESIRGVNVDYVLHNLLEKEIVTVVGRAESVGRPLLYGTTQRFLKVFALRNLEDLPKLREIEEIIKEIRSKGAEETIQLEIGALREQGATEPGELRGPLQKSIPDESSENQELNAEGNQTTNDSLPKE